MNDDHADFAVYPKKHYNAWNRPAAYLVCSLGMVTIYCDYIIMFMFIIIIIIFMVLSIIVINMSVPVCIYHQLNRHYHYH